MPHADGAVKGPKESRQRCAGPSEALPRKRSCGTPRAFAHVRPAPIQINGSSTATDRSATLHRPKQESDGERARAATTSEDFNAIAASERRDILRQPRSG